MKRPTVATVTKRSKQAPQRKGYLQRLWDDYSKIVLTNSKDYLDVRDENYQSLIGEKVWGAVWNLRAARQEFREKVLLELKLKAVTRKRPPKRR